MARGLRVVDCPNDLSPLPSSHITELTTTYTSISGDLKPYSDFHGQHVHVHKHRDIHLNKSEERGTGREEEGGGGMGGWLLKNSVQGQPLASTHVHACLNKHTNTLCEHAHCTNTHAHTHACIFAQPRDTLCSHADSRLIEMCTRNLHCHIFDKKKKE